MLSYRRGNKVAELLHVRQLVSQGLQVLVTLSAYFPEVQLLSHFLSVAVEKYHVGYSCRCVAACT
jgi:hypothetical protein